MRRLLSADGILLAQTAFLLVLVRSALVVFPFRTVMNLVNVRRASRPASSVLWAVTKASRYVPGAGHCLTQALVAKALLGNRGRAVDVRIGVAKDERGRLIAHAWLEADGAPIFGVTDSQLNRYSRLPQFDRV